MITGLLKVLDRHVGHPTHTSRTWSRLHWRPTEAPMRPRKLTLNGLLLWTLSRILDFDRQLSFLTRNLNTLLWRMRIHSNHCTLFYLPKTGSRVPMFWKPNHNGAVVTAFLRASIMSLWTRAAARETRSPAQRRFADPYTQFNRNVRIELFGTAKYFKLSPLRTPLSSMNPRRTSPLLRSALNTLRLIWRNFLTPHGLDARY